MPSPVSIREQVLAAFLAALQQVPNATVSRNNDVTLQKDFPHVLMHDGGHRVSYSAGSGLAVYTMDVAVQIAVAEEDAGTAINELWAQTILVMRANRTLGGLVRDVTAGDLSEHEQDKANGSKRIASATLAFEVTYCTKESDPYRKG